MIPSYADLKGSGRLGLLPDTVRVLMPRIERRLADFSGSLADLVNFQQLRVDLIILQRFALEGSAAGADAAEADLIFAEPRRDLATFREREARNLLYLKESLIDGLIQDADEIVVLLRELRGVIQEQRPAT